MKIAQNVTELIGSTPMVKLNKLADGDAQIVAKLESRNPGGSVKDRIAFALIQAAIADGNQGRPITIVEATSGNTGVGLAMVGAALGIKVVIAMPESMSVERRELMKAYGAKLLLTPKAEGMNGAVKAIHEYAATHPGCIEAKQFSHPANRAAHYENTAKEIWEDTDGQVDVIVAGVGTGGTISGVAKRLKELKPSVKAIAIEPEESALISTGTAGPHLIQGIGANFIPENYDPAVIDEVLTVSSADAISTAKRLAKEEGLMVGISSGANVAGAAQIASRSQYEGKLIVTILPDTGERYLSTVLFQDN